MKYAEKLQDPRWQKKRLSILERDEFACRLCKDTTTTLQVHHFAYNRNFEPWDVADSDLITYCKHCHAIAEWFKGVKVIEEGDKQFVDKFQRKDGMWIISTYRLLGDYVAIFHYEDDLETVTLDTCVPFEYIHHLSGKFLPKEPLNNPAP